MLPRQPAGDRANPSLDNLPCTSRVVQSAQTAIVLAAKLKNIELGNVESTEVGL
jgi:hypothetical protein